MTKAQIKAELRRSATCDDYPWYGCHAVAMIEAYRLSDSGLAFVNRSLMTWFLLLVAEAL